jgi:alpha-L-fucosidase
VWERKVNWGRGGDEAKQAAYDRMCEVQVAELCSRYGDWVEVWFDAGGSDRVKEVVERLQPKAVFYHSPGRWDHRWAGNERGVAPYPCWSTYPSPGNRLSPEARKPKVRWAGDPDGRHWVPCWCDAPIINHSWFWTGRERPNYYSATALANMYENSVGRNANLTIGLDVNPDGLIDDVEFRRCEEFGRELRRRFGKAIAETKGEGSEVELALPQPQRIDHVVVMEDIAHGERVRAYVVEGLRPGNDWEKLCDGISIGHKRIQRFPPTEVAKLRLRVTSSVAPPHIRNLAVFSCA